MAKKYCNMKVNYCGILKKCLIASIAVMLVGIVVAIIFGVKLDINFKGGSRFSYSYSGKIDKEEFQKTVEDNLGTKVTLTENTGLSGDSKYLVITVVGEKAISADKQSKLTEALQAAYEDNDIALGDSNTVNPSVAGSFFAKSIAAVVLAAIFVIVYIGVRFRKIGGVSAGVFAFVALIHDVLIAFFCTVIFRLEIDANFIAVVLTILGYSLNDTIVVYDRVRENRKLYPMMSVRENANLSINQSFVRSLLTALTTIVAVVIILIISEINGITSLRTFVIPMIFGLVSGFYSSMFLSCPLWVKWVEAKEKRPKKSK